MDTLLEKARRGEFCPPIASVAAAEGVKEDDLRAHIAAGRAVILGRQLPKAVGIGTAAGLRVKVSASIGLAPGQEDEEEELRKAQAAIAAGTDTLMDLSTSGRIAAFRRQLLQEVSCPVGTLPLYEAVAIASERYGAAVKMTVEDLFAAITRHAEDGVDFIAVHAALTLDSLELFRRLNRTEPLVSYGGTHLLAWMLYHERENPLYEYFDRLLEICRRYDVVLSLADAWRPGTLFDSLDQLQLIEMTIMGQLVLRAREAGVQVMVKGPGHVPVDHIAATMQLARELLHGAPYFVFGPVVTDTTHGWDHISAAIGGAISGMYGADFLCYVTPVEHLGLPNAEDVKQGVIAARIAAHAADVARRLPAACQRERELSLARRNIDWYAQLRLALDPSAAATIRRERTPESSAACSMCGSYCAMRIVGYYLGRNLASEC